VYKRIERIKTTTPSVNGGSVAWQVKVAVQPEGRIYFWRLLDRITMDTTEHPARATDYLSVFSDFGGRNYSSVGCFYIIMNSGPCSTSVPIRLFLSSDTLCAIIALTCGMLVRLFKCLDENEGSLPRPDFLIAM
jgi:hypothetical protein